MAIDCFHALAAQISVETSTMGDLGDLFVVIGLVIMGLTALIHIVLAFWIAGNATKLQDEYGSDALVSTPFLWFLIGLLTGIVGLAIYWGIHRSMLNPEIAYELHEEPPPDPA